MRVFSWQTTVAVLAQTTKDGRALWQLSVLCMYVLAQAHPHNYSPKDIMSECSVRNFKVKKVMNI